METPRYPTAIVVGASSGIGRELVLMLAEEGTQVAALARRGDLLQALASLNSNIVPVVHDVTDYASVPGVLEKTAKTLGGCDLLIYSSAVMPEIGAHEYNFDKDREMIGINVLGAMAWLDAVAMRFESSRHGTIVAIGSVAGDRGRRGQPVYNASKACLHAYVEALRNRLWNQGVTVTTIKPGPVDTELIAPLNMKGSMPVKEAASKILELAPSGGEKYLKFSHRVIFAVIRLLPSWIFRRIPI
ncbi:SDR family NAD(P)-dependent oxidoreductase [soil metagenome]